MEQIAAQGIEYVVMLNTYQGAIQNLKKVTEESNKADVYKQNVEILEPNIIKMRNLFNYYQNELLPQTRKLFEQVGPQMEQDPNFSAQAPLLAQVMDAVLRLDYMKTWQSQLNNDYSMYRRAQQLVRATMDAASENDLRTFFVTPSSVIIGVRTEITRVDGYENVLAGFINWAVGQLDAGNTDKESTQQLLRSLVFSIYLLEPIVDDIGRFDRWKRRIRLAAINRVLTANPSVPLYEQLLFDTAAFLKKSCPKFLEQLVLDGKKCIIL